MSMRRAALALALLLAMASSHSPTGAFQLTPSTPPGDVIERQLAALRDDDIERVYALASPGNKAQVGGIARFSGMVRSGPYRHLLGHSRSAILLETKIAASRQFLVRVTSSPSSESGDAGADAASSRNARRDKVREYWWSLSRCKTGEFSGSYMVDAVIPTQP